MTQRFQDFSWVGLAASQTAILPSALQGWFLPVPSCPFHPKRSPKSPLLFGKISADAPSNDFGNLQMNPFHTTSRHLPPLEGPLKSGVMMHAIIHLTKHGWYP